MKKRISLLTVFIFSLALLLGGCGGKSSFSSADTAEIVPVSETAAAGAENYELGFYNTAENDMAPPDAPQEVNVQMTAEENAENNFPVPLTRKLIRNMDLQVETMDFDPLITSLEAKVTELQGYIEQSDVSGNSITNQGRPSKKSARLTLRIPAEKLDVFILQVEAAGNITYKSESVSDVTLQYSDMESRLKTLRMEQDRLWELLAQADTTEAIILLEERLTEVSSEIETCESRIRYLNNSVTYSTVRLTIEEVDMESPTQPETAWQQIQRGFTRNLISLMDSLTRFIISFLSSLPVIVFLALLISIIVIIVRRIHRHKAAKVPKPQKPFPISSMSFSNHPTKTAEDAPQVNSSQIAATQAESAQTDKKKTTDTANKEDEA